MALALRDRKGSNVGRRCELGCYTWPDKQLYARCAICGEPTERYSNLDPVDEEEAKSILLHLEFEKYYEKRCRERKIPVDGPLQDDS